MASTTRWEEMDRMRDAIPIVQPSKIEKMCLGCETKLPEGKELDNGWMYMKWETYSDSGNCKIVGKGYFCSHDHMEKYLRYWDSNIKK